MKLLKQSTAQDVVVGPFVDDTDGVTPETGLTIAQADIQVSKDGAGSAQTNNATGATHDGGGRYIVPLDGTDTDTLGVLRIDINVSGAAPVWWEATVVPANVYDSLVVGSDNLETDAVEISGATVAADSVESNIGNLDAAISSLNDPTTSAIATAVLAAAVEGSITVKQSLALANAAAAGKLAGAGTTNVTLRNLADTLDRIDASVDASGNRSTVTRDFSDL